MREVIPFILFLFFVSACTPLQKTPTKPPTRPGTSGGGTKPSTPTAPVDTSRTATPTPKPGTHTPPNGTNPGTTTPPKPGTPPASPTSRSYRIGMLLPFASNQFTVGAEVPSKSAYALQFYAGAKLALEQLSVEEPKLRLKIDVLDTYLSDAEFAPVLSNPALDAADLYIGPVRGSHLTSLSKKTQFQQKPIVSPFSPDEGLVTNYPNFVQLNPSLRAHCEAIAEYVLQKYAPQQTILVCRERERERLEYFQTVAKKKNGATLRTIVEADAAVKPKTALKPLLSATKPTVFIVPSWSSPDFINGFLNELRAIKGKNQVIVFGMPQWEDFERIEPELLQDNQVHLISSNYVNFSAAEVRDFQQKYIDTYGTPPTKYAFDGYDTAYWTGLSLAKSGLGFVRVEAPEFQGLRSRYQLQSRKNATDGSTDYLENFGFFILKYGNGHFAPVLD